MVPLKDDMLSRLAERANVAQFVSFGPGPALPQRRARLRGHGPDHRFAGAAEAVGALLALAPGGSVNVRSFRAGAPKGGPLSYGLTRRDDVLAVLRARAGEGLHTIVNETIDVRDGGVSGVALGGLVEFAPGPRPGRSSSRARSRSATTPPCACSRPSTASPPSSTATPASGTSSASIPWSPGSARPTRSSGSGSRSSRCP